MKVSDGNYAGTDVFNDITDHDLGVIYIIKTFYPRMVDRPNQIDRVTLILLHGCDGPVAKDVFGNGRKGLWPSKAG